MFKPFPGYQRRRELGWKTDLTDEEFKELEMLNKQLDEHKVLYPDWQAGLEPMKVSLGELIRNKNAR